MPDRPLLNARKVHFVGDLIAFVVAETLEQAWNVDARVGLVDDINLDLHVIAEDFSRAAVVDQGIDRSKGI